MPETIALSEARALSLSRPWPHTILHLGKRIENRSRKNGTEPKTLTRYRGPLYLHAAQSWDKTAAGWCLRRGLVTNAGTCPTPYEVLSAKSEHPSGVIVARCRVVGHVEPGSPNVQLRPGDMGDLPFDHTPEERSQHQSLLASLDFRWWMGGYALILAAVEPTPLVPCRGYQRIWRVPADVLEQLTGEATP